MNVDEVDDESHQDTAEQDDDDDSRLFGQGRVGRMVLAFVFLLLWSTENKVLSIVAFQFRVGVVSGYHFFVLEVV